MTGPGPTRGEEVDAGRDGGGSGAGQDGSAPDAPILRLRELVKRFGSVTAVDRLSLEVREGEFVTLLGPSGCGKTTALRLVAGFETPDSGSIHFRGQEVTGWNPQRRGFGMVFQNYALFPHLDVSENVAFGLKSRRRPREEIQERVATALELVSLPGLGERAVQALSGGQQQRVALARALAIEPPLLLLDEPFSNLDAALRERTRTELRLLVKELGITALFVTHDQEEAFDLSDRIAVMDGGKLRQVGTPEELYRSPTHRFVAGFVGRSNVLSGAVEEGRGGEGRSGSGIRLAAGPWWPAKPVGVEAGASCEAFVRPEELVFVEPGREGSLRGRIRDRRFLGAYTLYFVEAEGVGILEVAVGAAGGDGVGSDGSGLRGPGSRGSGSAGPAVSASVGPGAAGPGEGDEVGVAPREGARLHLFASK